MLFLENYPQLIICILQVPLVEEYFPLILQTFLDILHQDGDNLPRAGKVVCRIITDTDKAFTYHTLLQSPVRRQ